MKKIKEPNWYWRMFVFKISLQYNMRKSITKKTIYVSGWNLHFIYFKLKEAISNVLIREAKFSFIIEALKVFNLLSNLYTLHTINHNSHQSEHKVYFLTDVDSFNFFWGSWSSRASLIFLFHILLTYTFFFISH